MYRFKYYLLYCASYVSVMIVLSDGMDVTAGEICYKSRYMECYILHDKGSQYARMNALHLSQRSLLRIRFLGVHFTTGIGGLVHVLHIRVEILVLFFLLLSRVLVLIRQ